MPLRKPADAVTKIGKIVFPRNPRPQRIANASQNRGPTAPHGKGGHCAEPTETKSTGSATGPDRATGAERDTKGGWNRPSRRNNRNGRKSKLSGKTGNHRSSRNRQNAGTVETVGSRSYQRRPGVTGTVKAAGPLRDCRSGPATPRARAHSKVRRDTARRR